MLGKTTVPGGTGICGIFEEWDKPTVLVVPGVGGAGTTGTYGQGSIYEEQCYPQLQIYVKDRMQGIPVQGMAAYLFYSYKRSVFHIVQCVFFRVLYGRGGTREKHR